MKLDSIATCILIGACGHVLTRVPSILFPDDLEMTKETEHPGERNFLLQRIHQIFQNINLARRSVRNHLTQWNASNKTWHFLSTSVKDNLGFVLFFLSLAGKSLEVPCPKDPHTIPTSEFTPTEENEEVKGISAQTLAVKKCLEYSRSKSPDAILSAAILVIISCGVMHLARNAIYTFGNRMLNGAEQSNRAITIARAVLARFAPSDRY